MIAFTETEYKVKVEKQFQRVFAGTDPYREPFQPDITPRLLLYEFSWRLQEPWLTPFVTTLKDLGEDSFFVSALDRPEVGVKGLDYHWYVPIEEAGQYGHVVYSQESAIYSINGTWGIICSDGDHALVGGSEILIANILAAVPDMDFRISEFIEVWKYYHQLNHVDIHWLVPMLSHVYGEPAARNLLSKHELAWLMG